MIAARALSLLLPARFANACVRVLAAPAGAPPAVRAPLTSATSDGEPVLMSPPIAFSAAKAICTLVSAGMPFENAEPVLLITSRAFPTPGAPKGIKAPPGSEPAACPVTSDPLLVCAYTADAVPTMASAATILRMDFIFVISDEKRIDGGWSSGAVEQAPD